MIPPPLPSSGDESDGMLPDPLDGAPPTDLPALVTFPGGAAEAPPPPGAVTAPGLVFFAFF
jgi:hypothetical protein